MAGKRGFIVLIDNFEEIEDFIKFEKGKVDEDNKE